MVDLNGREGLLFFRGTCQEEIENCQAMCCRIKWDVGLTSEECATGTYRYEAICTIDGNKCIGKLPQCINRRHRLANSATECCIYISEDNTCAIYDRRPQVCRDFSCKNGWMLNSVKSLSSELDLKLRPAPQQKAYLPSLHSEAVLTRNPLVGLKAVFFSPGTGELILVQKPLTKCSVSSSRIILHCRIWSDKSIKAFVDLFDGKLNLETLIAAFGLQESTDFSAEDINEMVQALIRHLTLIPVFR